MAALSNDQTSRKGPAATARARRRRIALRKKGAAVDEAIDGTSKPVSKASKSVEKEVLVDPETDKPKPSITGIKKQSRYVPGVPMTKEELKAWRKEARRVRNRESAAASRRRNRDRIGDLESEVKALKSKYAVALKFISDLEGSSHDCFVPQVLRQDLRSASMYGTPLPSAEVSSIETQATTISRVPFRIEENHFENVNEKHLHITAMIPRPTACVMIT